LKLAANRAWSAVYRADLRAPTSAAPLKPT